MGKTSRNGGEGKEGGRPIQMLTDPTVCTFKLSITCDSHELTRVTCALLAMFRYQLILDILRKESRCIHVKVDVSCFIIKLISRLSVFVFKVISTSKEMET